MKRHGKYQMKIILFDIDGTMIHSGGAGKRAMNQSFEEVFGIAEGLKEVSLGGKTDPQILTEALAINKIITDEDKNARFKERYFELLVDWIDKDLPGKQMYPGIVDLLQQLSQNDDVAIGLLTGNWQQGARTKLGHFNLNEYFSFGAFGDDSFNRNELLPFALERCANNGNIQTGSDQTIVIGDTPSDVECAQIHGAKALAVATGFCAYEDLVKSKPDWLFDDLSDVEKVLATLLCET